MSDRECAVCGRDDRGCEPDEANPGAWRCLASSAWAGEDR